jgi:hypothetical protein
MENDPVIIEPPIEPVPLVYNDSTDTTNMTNVLLIDSTLYDKQVFYDSANANTFPIIYDSTSKNDDLWSLLREKFPAYSIQRIALVFHARGPNLEVPFMNNSVFFQNSDLEVDQISFSENLSFLIRLLKEFNVAHIDFLACNTLQYSNWKGYYALLGSHTSVVVGASDDATGNIYYGGDWVMESTSEDVMQIYFNENITNYISLLASIIQAASGTIYLRMDSAGQYVEYAINNTSVWNQIPNASWPVTIENLTPFINNELTVQLTSDIIITTTYTAGINGYFIVGSEYIDFYGSYLGSAYYVRINSVPLYEGFIENGTSVATTSMGNTNVTGFIIAISGTTSIRFESGWLCQSYFGKNSSNNVISNCTNTAPLTSGSSAGGIVGANAATASFSTTASIAFLNCNNTANISVNNAGGIAGHQLAYNYGSATLLNCTNTGNVSGNGGGIAGPRCAYRGPVTFTNCTNSGTISGSAGGIAGTEPGLQGSVTFINCANSGNISGTGGGISGNSAGTYSSSAEAIFTGCINTGTISGTGSGGIASYGIGNTGGSATFTNCINTGRISGQYAGGIVGSSFATNTTRTCSIIHCYSIGNITGNNAGGITGAAVGFTNNGSYLPKIVDISGCYSLGTIATTCGGICGGSNGSAYVGGTPTINIGNCYSWGVLTDPGSGIVATSLPITTNTANTYVANGSWSDTAAKAVNALIGTPTSFTTGNPGAIWTKIINNTTTPYVLSSFNAQIYNPNSATSALNPYTTAQGVFDPSYNYAILYNKQVGNEATTHVFVSKGSTPYYYSYNNNTFVFTNSGTASDTITATIDPSNGILRYDLTPICFKKGTKILCENEIYMPIEEIKIGDLVKTYKRGYQKVIMSSHSSLRESSKNKLNQLYTYSREKNPDLIEDLHLTGGHSLLVDGLIEEESNDMKQISWHRDEYAVEDKFKLLACFSRDICVAAEQHVDIYHFTLEPPENAKPTHVYGIYANGILAESCSQGAMEKISVKNDMLLEDSNTPA